ncbi:MAG: hypothetical protein ACFFFT_00595 [Candidatus Thorarchaeota archaeon]
MDIKEILKICKLTEEEMNNYLRLTKDFDHKEDHKRAYRTMMNPTRRELLKFIGTNIRTLKEINNKFEEDEQQIKYHLSMLTQLFYVMDTQTGWKATPRGIGFLKNALVD